MAKYKNERKAKLSDPSYERIFESRHVDFLKIRRTITFEELKGIPLRVNEIRRWRTGDSLYKLSYEFFGTIEFWWTIALVNNKPTDAHFTYGDEVLIPVEPSILNNLLGSRYG